MAITVLKATKIGTLEELEIVAGHNGLDRLIETIGILDHEIIGRIQGKFGRGDFVLTTFTAAREDESLLIRCIKDLIACDVTGLAIKQVFYKTLPKEIIDYANKHNFPIFMFNEDIFTEDIISDLSFGIQTRTNIELMASKIDILFKNELKKSVTEKLAYEINPHFYHEHIVYFFKEKLYLSDQNLLMITERYNNSRTRSTHHSLIKYNDGIIIILSYKKISETDVNLDIKHILNQQNINEDEFIIGKSNPLKNINLINQSIRESMYASSAAEILSKDMMDYKNIGIYKFLIPHIKDQWIKSFVTDILNPLYSYDDGKLIETARQYIINGCDVRLTAEKMYQHKNTIRYRIKTMQNLIQIQSISEFNEQLSIAIKFEKLL